MWRIVSVTCSLLSNLAGDLLEIHSLPSLPYLVPGCTALHSGNHLAQSCCLQHTLLISLPLS